MPHFRDYAVEVSRPGAVKAEATRVLGDLPARRHQAEPRQPQLPPLRSRRDRLEPPGGGLRGDRQDLDGRGRSGRRRISAPDGRVMEVLSEHLCQGWLEGYLLTGRHGFFSCYEAFIHVVDSMVNQHAKWLKTTRQIEWRRADRIAELPADLSCLAAGPQRLLPPGSGLHRPHRQEEGRRGAHLSAAGRQLPAFGRRPLPAQPQLHQPDRRRQSARVAVARRRRGRAPLRRRARASGTGPATAPTTPMS